MKASSVLLKNKTKQQNKQTLTAKFCQWKKATFQRRNLVLKPCSNFSVLVVLYLQDCSYEPGWILFFWDLSSQQTEILLLFSAASKASFCSGHGRPSPGQWRAVRHQPGSQTVPSWWLGVSGERGDWDQEEKKLPRIWLPNWQNFFILCGY